MSENVSFAMDRSVRRKDPDGHLHIEWANISKAGVNPYYGREIPEATELGLEPDRIYHLLRPADELEKAASTFNNVRLLSKHKPVSADDPSEGLVAGSTGTDAEFISPYLRNSLVLWRQEDIDLIESGKKCQLSCGYRYKLDLRNGEHEGQHYDGIMRDIVGNHVALVEEGRAGPDVVIGDAALGSEQRGELSDDDFAVPGKRKLPIENEKHVRVAWDLLDDTEGLTAEEKRQARTRILHAARAHDIDTADWKKPVTGDEAPRPTPPKGKTMPTARKLATKAEILKRLRPFLAQDAKEEDVKAALDETDEEREAREKKEAEAKAADEREDDDREDDAEDESPDEDDDDKMKAKDRKGAKDAKTAKDAKPAAMDEAIRVAITAERTRSAAVALAREDVRPIVGAVSMAIDDAGEIYKIALKHLGADISDVPPAAYRSVLKTIRSHMPAQPKAGFVGAMDAAPAGVGKILDGLFANVRKS